jgi:hypothetical protein
MKANKKARQNEIDNMNMFKYAEQLMKYRNIARIRLLDYKKVLDKIKQIEQLEIEQHEEKRSKQCMINNAKYLQLNKQNGKRHAPDKISKQIDRSFELAYKYMKE